MVKTTKQSLWDAAMSNNGQNVIELEVPVEKYELLSLLFHQETLRIERDESIIISKAENKRYFGDSTMCYKCGEYGHQSRDCQSNIERNCMYCGIIHANRPCEYVFCDNCLCFGHRENRCREQQFPKVICRSCPSQYHYTHDCPRAWRRYVTRNLGQSKSFVMSCAYCHSASHFIDDCESKACRFSIFTKHYKELLQTPKRRKR